MKIAIDARFLTHPQMGGFKTYTTNLISALAKVDQQNDYIIYTDRHTNEVDLPRASNFTYQGVDSTLPIIGMPIREQVLLRRQILKEKLDLVHFLCNTATVNLPIRHIVTLHDTIQITSNKNLLKTTSRNELKSCLIDIYSNWTINKSIHNASRVITVSNYEKKEIEQTFGLDGDCIAVTHLAPNKIFSQADDGSKAKWAAELRNKYNISNKFILGIGYEPRKNIPTIIEAFAAIADQFPELNLVIVAASDSQREHFKKFATALKCENRVIFLPGISPDELNKFYNLAQIFLYPSQRESFGLPPLEAMACGTPVLASNTSSIPEILGDAAVLVDPLDLDSLVSAVQSILADQETRNTLTRNGIIHAKSYSWEKCARETVKIYHAIADDI